MLFSVTISNHEKKIETFWSTWETIAKFCRHFQLGKFTKYVFACVIYQIWIEKGWNLKGGKTFFSFFKPLRHWKIKLFTLHKVQNGIFFSIRISTVYWYVILGKAIGAGHWNLTISKSCRVTRPRKCTHVFNTSEAKKSIMCFASKYFFSSRRRTEHQTKAFLAPWECQKIFWDMLYRK